MLLAFYVPFLASVRGWTMPPKEHRTGPGFGAFSRYGTKAVAYPRKIVIVSSRTDDRSKHGPL